MLNAIIILKFSILTKIEKFKIVFDYIIIKNILITKFKIIVILFLFNKLSVNLYFILLQKCLTQKYNISVLDKSVFEI